MTNIVTAQMKFITVGSQSARQIVQSIFKDTHGASLVFFILMACYSHQLKYQSYNTKQRLSL